MSTPYGTGNWFHRTWVKAEANENEFLPIRLPWYVHPERDQSWRDRQDELLGNPRYAAQECDCDFNTSGDVVFYSEYLEFIEQTTVKEPVEKRGVDKNLWIWEPVDYSRSYMISADVARGDGKDYSAFHIFDIESNIQVGEYKGQIGTKEFGHLLVGIATEYNNALLVVENANIGWSTIQVIMEREYRNLYYSPKTQEVTAETYMRNYENNQSQVPGFTMSMRTRPMIIGKFQEYVSDKSVTVQSKRLLQEMRTFIWKNGRAEAQSGYNDDLIMSFGIGLYVRDTALKFRQHGLDMAKATLGAITKTQTPYQGAYFSSGHDNPYSMPNGVGGNEDFRWLL